MKTLLRIFAPLSTSSPDFANQQGFRTVHAVQMAGRGPYGASSSRKRTDQITDANVATARFALFLVGLFAWLAIALAAIGTYGVISYPVSRRTHEFGLRLALGANRWHVVRLVLGQSAVLAATGVALGLLGALALGRVLRSLIYEVSPADPITFATVALLVVAVAVLACYLPARRANAS